MAPYDSSFTPSHLYSRTAYPHLPPRPITDSLPTESSRRRRPAASGNRGQLGGILTVETLSPVKSRKRVRDDEESLPTPRRERDAVPTASTNRRGNTNTGKSRKYVLNFQDSSIYTVHHALFRAEQQQTQTPAPPQRGNSPSAESVLSITSHPVNTQSNTRTAANAATAPPPARTNVNQPDGGTVAEEAEPDAGEEQDGARYCYCQGLSYGEMVGCDDELCEYEWVSPKLHTSSRHNSSPFSSICVASV